MVACGEAGSPYAEDWLLAADRVVACSAVGPDDALEAARIAEERRDANGTLLAVTRASRSAGASAGAAYPEGAGGASRQLFSLGPGAVHSGSQADGGLRALARALVSPSTHDTEPEAVLIGGAASGPPTGPHADEEETDA